MKIDEKELFKRVMTDFILEDLNNKLINSSII